MQYSFSPCAQSHFPPSSLQLPCQKAHFICAAPSRLKNETKQNKGKERMLVWGFFFWHFPCWDNATAPQREGGLHWWRWTWGGHGLEVDTTRPTSHSMPYQTQVLYKITSYEKTENIQDHKVFCQVISLLIFMLHLNTTHHKEAWLHHSSLFAKSKHIHKKGLCLLPAWEEVFVVWWKAKLHHKDLLYLFFQSVLLLKSARESLNPTAKISPLECPSTTFSSRWKSVI